MVDEEGIRGVLEINQIGIPLQIVLDDGRQREDSKQRGEEQQQSSSRLRDAFVDRAGQEEHSDQSQAGLPHVHRPAVRERLPDRRRKQAALNLRTRRNVHGNDAVKLAQQTHGLVLQTQRNRDRTSGDVGRLARTMSDIEVRCVSDCCTNSRDFDGRCRAIVDK